MNRKLYIKKSLFRFNKNPLVKNPKGQGHVAYISMYHGNSARINTITHGKRFYGEKTFPFKQNPRIDKPDPKQSYFSVPRWEKVKFLRDKPSGIWRLSPEDRASIEKVNRSYKYRKRK